MEEDTYRDARNLRERRDGIPQAREVRINSGNIEPRSHYYFVSVVSSLECNPIPQSRNQHNVAKDNVAVGSVLTHWGVCVIIAKSD